MERLSLDEWGIKLAHVVSMRGTCIRRQVGCVLMDSQGIILSTGYNGVHSGGAHCIRTPCPGTGLSSKEDPWLKCEAIHAEQNALLQCSDVRKIHTCYVTVTPCVHCIKLLLNTGCSRIVSYSLYDQSIVDKWTLYGNTFILLPPPKDSIK